MDKIQSARMFGSQGNHGFTLCPLDSNEDTAVFLYEDFSNSFYQQTWLGLDCLNGAKVNIPLHRFKVGSQHQNTDKMLIVYSVEWDEVMYLPADDLFDVKTRVVQYDQLTQTRFEHANELLEFALAAYWGQSGQLAGQCEHIVQPGDPDPIKHLTQFYL